MAAYLASLQAIYRKDYADLESYFISALNSDTEYLRYFLLYLDSGILNQLLSVKQPVEVGKLGIPGLATEILVKRDGKEVAEPRKIWQTRLQTMWKEAHKENRAEKLKSVFFQLAAYPNGQITILHLLRTDFEFLRKIFRLFFIFSGPHI